VLVIGLIASSFGFGTDDNLSSNATSPLKSTQEERITNMNGEITNIKNQLIGLEKTLEQKRNDLSVRDGRITDKNLQIAELQTYITKNCDDPTGTAVNLCKKK
jgi:peptidoglycan hydrolase CwlO-like protein